MSGAFYRHVLESPKTFLRLLADVVAADVQNDRSAEGTIDYIEKTIREWKAQRQSLSGAAPSEPGEPTNG